LSRHKIFSVDACYYAILIYFKGSHTVQSDIVKTFQIGKKIILKPKNLNYFHPILFI